MTPDPLNTAQPGTQLPDVLFGTWQPPRPDFSQVHELVVTVHPREIVDGVEHETEFEVDVAHPVDCPFHTRLDDDATAQSSFCPVEDHVQVCGIDDFLTDPFGQPDNLTDDELAALNGKRIKFAMSTLVTGGGYPDYEYDLEEELVFDDGRPGALAIVERMAAGNPPVCACCGKWQRVDGTAGPALPWCHEDGWTHQETCSEWLRAGGHDYLCSSCEETLHAEFAPLDAAIESAIKVDQR